MFDPFRPNVVILGDGNIQVFGPALRRWLTREAQVPDEQIIVRFKDSSTPRTWLVSKHPLYLKRLGNLWNSSLSPKAGPSVSEALSASTRLVVVGLGDNLRGRVPGQRSVFALLDQIEAAAPRAAILWIGPAPATATKDGRVASTTVKLGRMRRNAWLREALETRAFVLLDSERSPQTASPARLYVDLAAFHAKGPSPANPTVVGDEAALNYEREALGRDSNLQSILGPMRCGHWSSFVRSRSDDPAQPTGAAARDFVDSVLPTRALLCRPAVLGDDFAAKPEAHRRMIVSSQDARIRRGPDAHRWTGERFESGLRVLVSESTGTHLFARALTGTRAGWLRNGELEPAPLPHSDGRHWTVIRSRALLRRGPPNFDPTGGSLKLFSRVWVQSAVQGFVKLVDRKNETLGWTSAANLGRHHRDDPVLVSCPMDPSCQIPDGQRGSAARIAEVHARIGGLAEALESTLDVEPAVTLAVWLVLTGGRPHRDHQIPLRFEQHIFFRRWGKREPTRYDRYFRHGGHAGVPGRPHQNHAFRISADEEFSRTHNPRAPEREYAALELASELAGQRTALRCILLGPADIPVDQYRQLGYRSQESLFQAFSTSERMQILGLFDALEGPERGGEGIAPLLARDWDALGRRLRGSARDGEKMAKAHELAQALLRQAKPRQRAPWQVQPPKPTP